MEKINFKQYFNCDYPGYKTFEQEVLIPIFGKYYQPEDIAENYIVDEEEAEKAKKANIKDILRMATITPTDGNASFNPIEVFDITVNDNSKLSRSRVAIQQYIRSKNFGHSHVLMLFHYETPAGRSWRFSYFYKDNTLKETTSARRYTYLFGEKEKVRTANLRFNKLLEVLHKKNHVTTDEDIENAFSVEKLSDEFFEKYLAFYVSFVKFITGKKESKESIKKDCFQQTLKKIASLGKNDTEDQYHKYFMPKYKRDEEECDKAVRNYVKKMMGRLVFLHFLQRKEWMCGDRDFMRHLFLNSNHQDDFLDRVLEPLFFAVLNTQPSKRKLVCKKHNDYPYNKDQRVDWDENLIDQWQDIPYLNGGLFEQEKIDECRTKFPKEYFEALFNFFDEYNFTIDENDPHDAIVGVDPEMLSKIFENLLEDNKDKGAFYTPKTIVHYMCTESLIAYLQEKCKDSGITDANLRKFVLEPHAYKTDDLTDQQRDSLSDALKNVHVCDPAIGSGAFPMGMLNAIYACRHELEPQTPAFDIKLHIIQNNIFGVDIEQGAVDIARLRFWLALVVEEQEPHALPNLDYRIVRGNSLLTTFMDEHVNIDSINGRTKTAKLKKELAVKQGEYYSLSGEEKLKKEIEIKLLILEILEVQLNIDKKAAEQKNITDVLDAYNNSQLSAKAIKESQEAYRIAAQKAKLMQEMAKIKNKLTSKNKDLFDKARTDIDFFDWKVIFSNVFDNYNGFDIVIGNPPYGADLSEEHKDLLKKEYDYLVQRIRNSYLYFIGVAEKLAPKGIISYIVPNELLFQVYMTNARAHLLEHTELQKVINVGNAAFDRVVPTCIFLLKHIENTEDYNIELADIREITKEQLPKVVPNMHYDCIKRSQMLNTPMCTFSFDFKRNKLLNKLIEKHKHLEDYCDNIFNGVSTSCNDVYLATPSMLEEKSFEEKYVKPTIKGEHITKYYVPSCSPLYLLYIERDFNFDEAPNITKYLKENKELLIKKCVEKRTGKRPWHVLFRARKEEDFLTVPKIVIRQTADSIIAAKDTLGYYSINSTNVIIISKKYIQEIDYILAVLNSKLIDFYYKEISQEGGRILAEVKPIRVRNLPIAETTENIKECIEKISVSIQEAKSSSPLADTSVQEQEIDRLVYKLYGLTYDEVKIVDPETPITEEEYNKE